MNMHYFFILLTPFAITYCADVTITPLKGVLPSHPEIEYIKCFDEQPFSYKQFPISIFSKVQPNEGLFAQSFVLKIPNGKVYSHRGWIQVDNYIIDECIPPYFSTAFLTHIIRNTLPEKEAKHISGKVAVITMIFDDCYSHWLYNILGRLALLEMQNIEYDWLYVAYDKPYMKETLKLLGIDPAKIITPFGDTKYIQADELIVPSHPGTRAPLPNQYSLNWTPVLQYCKLLNLDPEKLNILPNFLNPKIDTPVPENISILECFLKSTPFCGNYFESWAINYLRNKFLPLITNYNFSKKIFISRTDASIRRMINEDEVFALFEQRGFKRYILSNMSIIEQVALFNQAESIVAAHGSGLMNLMFCQPGTKLIEIFQCSFDPCFCYLSQTMKLDYYFITTMTFNNSNENKDNTIVPLDIISNFITGQRNL